MIIFQVALMGGLPLFIAPWYFDRLTSFVRINGTRQAWIMFVVFALIFFLFYRHYKINEKITDILILIACLIGCYGIIQNFGYQTIKPDFIRQN